MEASEVSNLLYQQLSNTAKRQKIIASNIANLNTPNYKTKDISFDEHLKKVSSNELALKITHKNHIPFEMNNARQTSKSNIYEVQNLEEQNDGNNVSLDQQISEMSKNAVLNDAISNSIKRDSRWFKLIVDASGKN